MYDRRMEGDQVLELERQIAEACGTLNVAHARLVALIATVLKCKAWEGFGIRSPEHWVTWKTGVSPARATDLVRIARRSSELPVTMEAFDNGELGADQVAAIAKFAPKQHDADICTFAHAATVPQLRSVLRRYHFDADQVPEIEPNEAKPSADAQAAPVDRVSMHHDDHGQFHLHADVNSLEGAEIEAALREAHDALFRAGNQDVTWTDALLEVCRRSMAAITSVGRADTYRVYLHVDTDKVWVNGGPTLPASLRSQVLCDCSIHPYVITGGKPINIGRVTRTIPRHTRRAVLDRDGTCRYPGCTSKRLEVHHIIHWEHGGPTDTDNLAGFCSFHHHRKHDGTFDVTGHADEPDGLVFTRPNGSVFRSGPESIPPLGPLPTPPPGRQFVHPSGEPLQEKWIYFDTDRRVA